MKKDSSNCKNENRAKNTSKYQEIENISAHREVIQSKLMNVLTQINSLQGVETTKISSCSLKDWEDLSLLSYLL
jgi:hypothetical protein